jgi:hypothetical protein
MLDFIEIEGKLGAHNYKPLDVVLARGDNTVAFLVDRPRPHGGAARGNRG